jgi:hypothetical protein
MYGFCQEFVHAVDQLLKVRQGSVELRRKLAEVNDALQSRGTRWAEKVIRKPSAFKCI